MATTHSKESHLPTENPLGCLVPKEVVLTNPPLKLALAQIRFSPILAINQPNSSIVASFQEAIRVDYPDYQGVQGLSVSFPQGVGNQPVPVEYLQHVFKDEQGWEISLTHEFIALSTTVYRTKSEFAHKVQAMSDAVVKHISPRRATRLGIRFVDRIEGDILRDISKYVNSEFLGPHVMFGENMELLMTEALLKPAEGGKMIARWGSLSSGQSVPGMEILVIDKPSWILDTDIYTGQLSGFEPAEIANHAEKLAGRAYAFFRGVFKDEFIQKCGGKL